MARSDCRVEVTSSMVRPKRGFIRRKPLKWSACGSGGGDDARDAAALVAEAASAACVALILTHWARVLLGAETKRAPLKTTTYR